MGDSFFLFTLVVNFAEREAMKTAEDIIRDKSKDMICISHTETIHKALQIMVANKIGAILVKKDDEIVGIWTERDLMHDCIAPGFDHKTARIGDYMTTDLKTALFDTPISKLEEMFLGLFLRHILVEKEGEYIGLLSIGDVVRASLLEKDRQIKELNALASWEYYENWGWERKKR